MRSTTACFTGPRPEKLMRLWDERDPEIIRIKNELFRTVFELATISGYRLFLTGMARGIDIIAAEAVLSVQKVLTWVELAAVIPYRNQRVQQPEFWGRRYDAILEKSGQILILQEEFSPNCLIDRNHYMIDHSSHLIAVSNGSQRGGTAATIRYAKKQQVQTTVIRTGLSVSGQY